VLGVYLLTLVVPRFAGGCEVGSSNWLRASCRSAMCYEIDLSVLISLRKGCFLPEIIAGDSHDFYSGFPGLGRW